MCVQVLNYCRNRKHIYPLWFSGISNQIMWWTYVKAFWRGVAGATGAKITFKTTLKGAGRCALCGNKLYPVRITRPWAWMRYHPL